MEWQLAAEDPKLPDVVARRIARGRNFKYFANARTVRTLVENSIKASLLRQGKGAKPVLKIIDCLGQRPDPQNIPELQEAMDELERMTGLQEKRNDDGSIEKRSVGVPVKKAVQNLVLTAQANYDKELRGEKPLDIALNRLLIGNPGTGERNRERALLGIFHNGGSRTSRAPHHHTHGTACLASIWRRLSPDSDKRLAGWYR